jgi:hypothetical protein
MLCNGERINLIENATKTFELCDFVKVRKPTHQQDKTNALERKLRSAIN